jgi:SAM-dependent methyltransferase
MINWKLWFRKNFPTHVERSVLKKIEGKILDVGCGKGLFLFYCQSRNLDVVGLEISKKKIKEAKTITNRFLVLGDACNLPFKEEVFDNVVAFDVIEHIKNPLKAIEEMSRVLKFKGKAFFHIPRGKGIFRHMEGHINFFDNKEKAELLLKKFFKIDKSKCVGFKWFIRPPLIPPSYNIFWVFSTFVTHALPEFLSTHYYFETTKK